MTAHAIISKFEQPDEMGAYDRWGLKLIDGKKASVAAMLKEWADAVLFANYKTIVITTSRTARSARPRVARTECSIAPMPPRGMRRTAGACRTRSPWSTSSWLRSSPSRSSHGSSRRCSSRSRRSTSPRSRPEQIEQARSIPDPFEPERPAYLKPLYDLMQRDGISAETVSEAIFKRGYFPEGTPVDSLSEDFANFLVAVWDGMREYINSGMVAGRKE